MKNFLLVSNIIKDSELMLAKEVAGRIKAVSNDITINIIDMSECKTYSYENVECVLVLGGDGTFIRVAKDISEKNVPLIGINNGNLGYLTEIEIQYVEAAIEHLLKDNYSIEERMMLDGEIVTGDAEHEKHYDKISALNDVVITRNNNMVIGYSVYVNDHLLKDYYADGIILSTATGSTGYNLSAGGPIASPDAKLILLTPVCPHTFNSRTIILSAEDKITVKVLPPKGDKEVDALVTYDGRDDINVATGDRIIITKSDKKTKICKISDVGFLKILQQKMSDR